MTTGQVTVLGRGLGIIRYLRYCLDMARPNVNLVEEGLNMARTRMVRRWRRNMEVRDDADYVNMLATLSEGSVRRNFNPYTDRSEERRGG